MEFNEKLQELRRRKGLTQEELAEALYVSRAAISKWESGRGLPNIDSLKAISKFFSVSLDDLLSGDELLMIAEDDQKQKEAQTRNRVFGLLDCSMVSLLFLPFFGQEAGGMMREVSLFVLTGVQPWLRVLYFVVVIAMAATGVLMLALQSEVWEPYKNRVSLFLHIIAALLFILSRQPYAAVFVFLFLLIKLFLLTKRP